MSASSNKDVLSVATSRRKKRGQKSLPPRDRSKGPKRAPKGNGERRSGKPRVGASSHPSFRDAPLVSSDTSTGVLMRSKSRKSVFSQAVPTKERVRLTFISTYTCAGSGGAGIQGLSFAVSPNSAFVVDILTQGSNTTTPGFSAFTSRYASYRVYGYDGEVEFVNRTTSVPVGTYVCHSNSALGVTGSGGSNINIQQYYALRPGYNSFSEIGGGASDAKAVHRFGHRSIESVVGEKINQPGYKSLVNGSPTILTYIVFGTLGTISTTAHNVSVILKVTMDVEFSDYIDTLVTLGDRMREGDYSPQMCAGCTLLSQTPDYEPCPCGFSEVCGNCLFTHPCAPLCVSPRCTKKAVTPPMIPPRRSSLGKLVPYKPKSKESYDE